MAAIKNMWFCFYLCTPILTRNPSAFDMVLLIPNDKSANNKETDNHNFFFFFFKKKVKEARGKQ